MRTHRLVFGTALAAGLAVPITAQNDAGAKTATVYDLKSGSLGIEGRLYAPDVAAGCREAAQFSAVYAAGQAAE
jgi:hypothetical protein